MKDSGVVLLVVIIFVAAAIGIWSYSAFILTAPPPIDGIPCGLETTIMHIHMHLDIFINGQPYAIPAGVGIVPNKCLYWLHTHDDTGIIHLESPYVGNFTLGQFFDIWGMPFNGTQIFDYKASAGSPLAVYVNGNPVNGDYRSIIFNAHDEIAIVYGTPPAQIPSSYIFPPRY
jgi:hypothetical protein